MSHLVSVREYTSENIGDLAANARALRAKLYAPEPRQPAKVVASPPEAASPREPVDALAQYRLAYSSCIPQENPSQVAKRIKWEEAAEAGISIDMIEGESRVAQVAKARQKAMWRIAKATPLSLKRIGQMFGDKDHTTTLHAIRRMNDAFEEDVRSAGGVRGAKVLSWDKAKAAARPAQ